MTLPDTIAGFSFYPLEFGASGEALSPPQLDRLIAESKRAGVTDLIFLAHGFRCDAADATNLYTNLLTTLRPNLGRAEFAATQSNRIFAAAGTYWPSKEFRESFGTTESVHETLSGLRDCANPDQVSALDHARSLLDAVEINRSAQDNFVASVLSAFDDGRTDSAEGLPLLHLWRGSDLLDRLRTPQSGTEDEGGIGNIPIAAPVVGGIDRFLNMISWYSMKNLSGEVGANGVAVSVTAFRKELGNIRIHLAGHSLGGRVMAACCKALGQSRAPQVTSLSLLEAAFSHFGFSPDAGSGEPGFFREVIGSRIVCGPMISTFSKQDAVVGTVYACASRLAHDSLQAIGDASDPYGGIGRNGALRTPESTAIALHQAGEPYQWRPGIVTCLDGSAGLITGHGDVTNPHVTYAIASAICEPGV
jgi:hypothetical protein